MARPNSIEREKADKAFAEWLDLGQYETLKDLPPRHQYREFEVRAILYDYLEFYIDQKGSAEGINNFVDYETFLSREYHKRQEQTVAKYQFSLGKKFNTDRSADGYVTRVRWSTLAWYDRRRNKSLDSESQMSNKNASPFTRKLLSFSRESAYVDDEVGGHRMLTMTKLEGDDKQIIKEFTAALAKARKVQGTNERIGTKQDFRFLSEPSYLALCDLILYSKFNDLILTSPQITRHIPGLVGDIRDTVLPRALRLLDPIHLSGLRKPPN